MTAEAAISVTVKDAKGALHTLRGDSWGHFAAEAEAMLAHDAGHFLTHVKNAFLQHVGATVTEAQGIATVTSIFPTATPVSTVGQPLPQPGIPAAPTTAPPAPVASGEPQPGELRVIDGVQKKWVPAGVSKAGKQYRGFWGNP